MRSKRCITRLHRNASTVLVVVLFGTISAQAQRLAILAPERTGTAERFAEALSGSFGSGVKIPDNSLAEAAFRSVGAENPFNMSAAEARRTGAAIGSEFFLLIRADTLRRSSFQRPEYYESFAAVYLVSSRSGRLKLWKLEKAEEATPAAAEDRLLRGAKELAREITQAMAAAAKAELSADETPVAELPEKDSSDFRAPAPYRRLKPEYTPLAYFYGIAATVDIVVVLDEKGSIVSTAIDRWAGYGLDESVTEAVRKMNWRPAERNGRFLPMRFLVRYNFRKIDKE